MEISSELLAASIAEQVAAALKPAPIKSMKFSELYRLYFEQHAKLRLKNTDNVFYFYKTYGGPRWGNIQVHEIKRRDVQNWVDEIGAAKPTSAVKACNLLSIIINWGMNHDHIPQMPNPCKGVEKFKLHSRERFLQPVELNRFKWALSDEAPLLRDFFSMCLATGARRSNVLSMAWDEIDLNLCLWRIPPEKFKNGDSHTIPLNSMAMEILNRRQRLKQNCWVFPGRSKSHLREPKRAWARVLKRANISDLHIHDLRRTFGAYLAMQGESQYIIAGALGHKDVRSSSVYARLNLVPIKLASEKVADNWQDLFATPLSVETKPTTKAIPFRQPVAIPQNAAIQILGVDQVIIEAKILTAIRAGGCTKKSFYNKIGSQFQVNGSEMERILNEMIGRKLIEAYQNDNGIWQYTLAEDIEQNYEALA